MLVTESRPVRWLFIAACALAAACGGVDEATPELELTVAHGRVLGTLIYNQSNDALGVVRAFLGVPYAKPPVGALRWRPPQVPDAWPGIRSATAIPSVCWQPEWRIELFPGLEREIDEDCLTVNIWTTAHKGENLPVMVWYHGGGFNGGFNSQPHLTGTNQARKGVVVVSVNYRLGKLGFLVHPALDQEAQSGVSGNYGLMDQIAALRWVHDNIDSFGGDPENVTIFGLSAGALSVQTMMMSPQAGGLFQRAISNSGGYLGFLRQPDDPDVDNNISARGAGITFGQTFGISGNDESSAAALREIPAARIYAGDSLSAGEPIVDGYFVPGTYAEMYGRGLVHPVDVISGSTLNEGKGNWATFMPSWSDETYTEWLTRFLQTREPIANSQYGRSTDVTAAEAGTKLEDDLNTVGKHALLRWFQRARPGQQIYSYLFTRATFPVAGLEVMTDTPLDSRELGAYHTSTESFIFDNLEVFDRPWDTTDLNIADVISSYFVNFARTGDPNGPGLPYWPRYDPSSELEFAIGEEFGLGAIPNANRIEVLEGIVRSWSGIADSTWLRE